MKKFLICIVVLFCFLPVNAVMNEPGAPVKMKSQQVVSDSASSSLQNSNSDYTSDSGNNLNSIAMSMLRAAEARDNATMNKYFRKLAEAGVKTYYQPEIIAKKTPNCPPIKMELNGRNLSGSKCAKMGYVYEGETYWVGYCK